MGEVRYRYWVVTSGLSGDLSSDGFTGLGEAMDRAFDVLSSDEMLMVRILMTDECRWADVQLQGGDLLVLKTWYEGGSE